jgi:hypothetical protein
MSTKRLAIKPVNCAAHCPYQILRLTKNQGLGRRSCDIVTGVIERAWEYGSGFRTLRGEGHGHPASAFGPAVTLAACLCRTGDRYHSTRLPGSHDRIQRALFVPTPSELRQLLSSKPNALGFGERQSGAPTDPTASCGTDHRDSGSGWAPSSLRPARRLNCSPTKAFLAAVCLRPTAPSLQPTCQRTILPPWFGDEHRRPSQPCISFP